VRTRAVQSLDEHPLPVLVAAGVPVTVNSDDPPMFGTTLEEEYAVAARLLNLDETGVADLARAAVNASFLPPTGKSALLAEIDAYSSTH
jgi:aminodeoxyfutalosine deaminase